MLLDRVSLTQSGRPSLLPGEVEQSALDSVDFCFEGGGGLPHDQASEYTGGRCQLTTHRLIWISESRPGRCCALRLEGIKGLRIKTKFVGSPSLYIHVALDSGRVPVPHDGDGVANIGELKLRYKAPIGITTTRSSEVEEFMRAAERSIARKAWLADASSATRKEEPGARADPGLLAQMEAMGFQPTDAAQALVYTGNTGLEQAVNWLLEQGAEGGRGMAAALEVTGDTTASARFSAADAGISGILRRQQEEARAAGSTLKSAFTDLKNLEERAREVVELAERFRSALSRTSDGSIDGVDAEAQAAMEEELISMGIASPVTKETAGRSYHKELSRQLSDFLFAPLERSGGMMTMQEVYCLFNRARGTELVSPDDLNEAVKLFESIKSPMKLRIFESGVKVVCSASLEQGKVDVELAKMLRPPGVNGLGIGITERDAARLLGISLMVAREHILAAEKRGVLCRDDSSEGLRFFHNFFRDSELISWTAH